MDKNKSRTDLLAAGRKKLQQFRQKKDGKGNSSQGKSSKKSDKSEQHDGDIDVPSTAAKPAKSLHGTATEISSQHLDSNEGFVDLSVSHSLLDPVAPDVDVATFDPFSVPVSHEMSIGEVRLVHNAELPAEGLGVGESGSTPIFGKENDVHVLVPNEWESILTVEPEVARILSPRSSGVAASEGESVHATLSLPVTLSAPLVSVDSTEDVSIKMEERISLASQQDFPDISLTQAREDQEPDCLGSKQLDKSGGIELEEDGRLTLSEHAGSAGTLAGAVLGVTTAEVSTGEAEKTGKADDVCASAVTGINSRGLSFTSMSTPEKCSAMSSFNEEELQIASVSGESGSYKEEVVQADVTSHDDCEGSKQHHLPEESFISKGESHVSLLGKKVMSLSGEGTLSHGADASSVSLSQLADLVKRLNEDEFMFLLKSRDSTFNAGFVDSGSSFAPESGFTDFLEAFKEQLYLANIAKDFFHSQLAEQSELQREFDHQRHLLNDEMSILRASLNEAYERNRGLVEDLKRCQSELQAVSNGREELENQFHAVKAEVEEFSARASELQIKLERSQGDLSSLLLELADCKGLVVTLQEENANLSQSLSSVTEEKKKLEEESKELGEQKEYFIFENGKLSSELAEWKDLVAAVQVENSKLSGNLASIEGEMKKLEDNKEFFVCENEKMLTELTDCKGLMAALREENAKLSGSLDLAKEERKKFEDEKEHLVHENEKLSLDLADCKSLLAAVQLENTNLSSSLTSVTEGRKRLVEEKDCLVEENEGLSSELHVLQQLFSATHAENLRLEADLKEANMCLEQLTEENMFLNSNLDLHKAKISEINNRQIQMSSQSVEYGNRLETFVVPSRGHNDVTDDEDSHQIPQKEGVEFLSPVLEKHLSDGFGGLPQIKHLERGVHDNSFRFVVLKGHLEDAENILGGLEKAIEKMHSHSQSLSRSGGNVAALGVSKLIQAFESKAHLDDHESEEKPLIEDQSATDLLVLTKEQTGNLRGVLKELNLAAENASELFRVERDGRELADVTLRELQVQYEAMNGHTHSLEEANIELEVQCEAMKQHVYSVEANNNELGALYEALMQQDISLKAENGELVKKLADYQSRISESQVQLYELQRSSDEMASLISNQIENLQQEVAEKSSKLEQEWNSAVSQIAETVGKLDACTGRFFTSTISTDTYVDLDISSHFASSVDTATKVIEELQEKLEVAHADQEEIRSFCVEVTAKLNDLHGKNEMAVGMLCKIYGSLRKLVNDSHGYVEENEIRIQNEELLDPLLLSDYETLIEQLGNFLGKKMLLESENIKLNSELMSRTKDIEELSKRCLDLNAILKLIEVIEGVVNLEDVKIDPDKSPLSRLECFVSFLLHKYKEADELASLTREESGSKVMELSELQEKMHQLNSLNLQQESVILSLKESLSKAEEAFVAVRSQLHEKVTELEQSEQRVSSVREKLSIAVSKGKGLIAQRDSLKQSLAETSSELERCSQELQLKDARLHEVETKLKTYSEAGERVEALESELSYIRNSATALRESFILKDSMLQRIEEILEELELPEHFHSRDIIEKVDWLARSVTGNPLPLTDWDQKSSGEGGSYSDAGFVVMDAWKEDMQPSSNPGDDLRKPSPNPGDDLRRKYEELQSKFYGLAEQNEMLEQSLMERNNLMQRWEEALDRISMPAQLRSMETEDRLEWLGSALSEAYFDANSLQQKIDDLETHCRTLAADLEGSQGQLSDVEAALQAVIHEKEHLSERLEILTCDHEKASRRAVQFQLENDKLQNEITGFQEKLVNNLRNEEHICRVEGVIRRLLDSISDVLEDPGTEDLVLGGSSVECLDGLLRKLIEKYTSLSSGKPVLKDAADESLTEKADAIHDELRTRDTLDAENLDTAVLKKELEEALGDLMHVKEERDNYVEKHQSLVCEVEALNRKGEELLELLNQEEQKSASVREKLNVAVRKGKSLVQQRDSLKQFIEEMNTQVEHLKSEINHQQNVLAEYEQKIMDLSAYPERVAALESECLFLRNRLIEAEHSLQEKGHTLSMLLNSLADIDVDGELPISDPVEKLEQIGTLWRDLQAALSSSENESRKSKRAAELLLAELNEVQERNDGLQEELAKAGSELLQLSKERDIAEATKLEALSHLENLSSVKTEERKNQVSEFMALRSSIEQLRKGFFDFNSVLVEVFSKDFDFLQRLEAGMKSCLKSGEVVGMPLYSAQSGISRNSESKEDFLSTDCSPDSVMQEHVNDKFVSNVCSFVKHQLQEVTAAMGGVKEKLQQHSILLDEKVGSLSKVMENIHREMGSLKDSFETTKKDIIRLETIEKEKDMEVIVMRRNIALLYEACTSSIMEIESRTSHLVANNVVAGDVGMNLKSVTSADRRLPFDEQALLSSEEQVRMIADGLLLAVRNFSGVQSEMVEGSQKEMKSTIANLQKELQEKDVQNDRICMELVNQIKEAEAAARNYSLDLQSMTTRVHDLEKQAEVMEEERGVLEQRLKELQDGEATSVELQERVRSLTDLLATKDQEIESLMQALDEEETQMEELTDKIKDLEKVVHQKNVNLENLEASRGKAMKKLTITVSKFDELHHLSAGLLAEVEKLQSQLQDRDSEISFLRQEVTRCTNDVLIASQMSNKKNSDEICELLAWLGTMISRVWVHDEQLDDKKCSQPHEYRETLQKQITSIISELEDLRVVAQNRDALLQVERNRVEELMRKGETLENSLHEKESQLSLLRGVGDSGQATSVTSELLEVEPVINKRAPAMSSAPQVRSLRKVNNDQVAIAIDMDPSSSNRLEDEDDDKVHGFKSLTTSRIVPRFTRPVTDMIDGLWVSCDRALMRQPALRLGIIVYWAVLHALLATFAV